MCWLFIIAAVVIVALKRQKSICVNGRFAIILEHGTISNYMCFGYGWLFMMEINSNLKNIGRFFLSSSPVS